MTISTEGESTGRVGRCRSSAFSMHFFRAGSMLRKTHTVCLNHGRLYMSSLAKLVFLKFRGGPQPLTLP